MMSMWSLNLRSAEACGPRDLFDRWISVCAVSWLMRSRPSVIRRTKSLCSVSFQSRDSVQLLKQKAFTTGTVSVAKTSVPYDVMKTAFYDGRIEAPRHDKALEEIVRLERHPKTGLIDHAPRFSKDCADAMAGVVYGLTYRREIWVRHGVPIHGAIAKTVDELEHAKVHPLSAAAVA
jgi:hypothetical protein